MKYIFALLGMILIGYSTEAQTKSTDAIAIENQVDKMVSSWNTHNYSDMKSYATAECSWVNIVGMHWKGLKEVEYAHQFYHNNMFKQTAMTKKDVSVRVLSPTTALVHFKSYITEFTTPSGEKVPAGNDLALLVFVKQNGKWLLTAGENVTINPEAQRNDPILHMKH